MANRLKSSQLMSCIRDEIESEDRFISEMQLAKTNLLSFNLERITKKKVYAKKSVVNCKKH